MFKMIYKFFIDMRKKKHNKKHKEILEHKAYYAVEEEKKSYGWENMEKILSNPPKYLNTIIKTNEFPVESHFMEKEYIDDVLLDALVESSWELDNSIDRKRKNSIPTIGEYVVYCRFNEDEESYFNPKEEN